MLLKYGANPQILDNSNKTAKDWARDALNRASANSEKAELYNNILCLLSEEVEEMTSIEYSLMRHV